MNLKYKRQNVLLYKYMNIYLLFTPSKYIEIESIYYFKRSFRI